MPSEPHALAALVGPFHDQAAVESLLGVTEPEVGALRAAGSILALETADQVVVFPAWQFVEGRVDPRLVPVNVALRGQPAWSAALWWVTPNPDVDELTPLAWVQQERPVNQVVVSAARTAREWS